MRTKSGDDAEAVSSVDVEKEAAKVEFLVFLEFVASQETVVECRSHLPADDEAFEKGEGRFDEEQDHGPDDGQAETIHR
jgi:hypothetical protein